MLNRIVVIQLLIFLLVFLSGIESKAASPAIEQTIDGFTLSGFEEKGNKAWEITGKTANILSGQIRLNDFLGTIYGQEKIVVTADEGDFDRVQNKVHLQDNVVITTESGARLTTDYLDWDKASSLVTTEAPVDIEKDNMVTTGIGIEGDTNLQKVDLKRDVRLEIDNPEKKIVVTCDGPLNIDYVAGIAVFYNDVSVNDGESQMYSDLMEVFFQTSGSSNASGIFLAGSSGKITRIVAKGDVKIVQEGNTSYSEKAIYNADNQKIVLVGQPKIIMNQIPDLE